MIYFLLLPAFLMLLWFGWFLVDVLFIDPDPGMWMIVWIILAVTGIILFDIYK